MQEIAANFKFSHVAVSLGPVARDCERPQSKPCEIKIDLALKSSAEEYETEG